MTLHINIDASGGTRAHCPDVRLVARRVSAPWEVTDE